MTNDMCQTGFSKNNSNCKYSYSPIDGGYDCGGRSNISIIFSIKYQSIEYHFQGNDSNQRVFNN